MNKKTKKNRNNNKNKTIKTNMFSYYSRNYKNTTNIPVTNIINYIKNNFSKYDNLKNQLEKENKYVIYLDDCFNFNGGLKPGLKVFSFDSPIEGNPNMPIDKLISYAFYIKTRSAFIDETNNELTNKAKYLEILKNQMGKDIRRGDRTINGIEYGSELYSDQSKDNYIIADIFYQTLINYFYKIRDINLNVINKICLLSCQNIFNLITDLISIKLNELLSPEMNSVFRPVKSSNIIITNELKSMEFNFDSKLIISRDNEPINPEYPCGDLSFKFLVDFTNNTFKFNEFKLEYNIDNCGPPKKSLNKNINNINTNMTSNIKLKYAIPAVLGIGGIIATPFILGALGGKKHKKIKKNNHNNTKKNKVNFNSKKKYFGN